VLYTMAGSALMLVAIVALGAVTGSPTFAFSDLLDRAGALAPGLQLAFFAAFALAFAVKVPLFPFHTWLPDAHVDAPTAGSVLLAGVLLKLGSFGFLRLALPLFPAAAQAAVPWVMALAIVGIWYGAWVAYAQRDVKSLVAYSSVSHMGIVMVGLFALNTVGISGSVLQMVNHGLVTGALFFLVGMLYERAHSRRISDFSGLWATMPRFSALFLVVLLASIGLPATNGFVGEWLSLLGAFAASPWYAVPAAFGVVLGAVYMLWVYQRLFFGPANPLAETLPDLSGRELAVLLPLVALIFWIGLYPDSLLGPIGESSQAWAVWMARGQAALAALRP
jgi:NADH-quinone oxidoreductase subunit M